MNIKYIEIIGVVLAVVLTGWFLMSVMKGPEVTLDIKPIAEVNSNTTEKQAEAKPIAEETKAVTNNNTNLNTNKTMTKVTELKMEDSVVGTGAEAKAGDSVTVHYVGTLMDGTMFDASKNHGSTGFTFTLGAGQVIKGWDVGVAGMKVGGKRKLTIPSDMAYGNQAVGGVIPANSDLIFEVELLSTGK
jgi:FKBP-type peptidyl-prolyl cis-trans isomerase